MPLNKALRFLKKEDGNLKEKSIRAGIWVTLSSFVVSALSLVRYIILARLLSAEIFGLWAICMMIIRGVDVFTETGFSSALIHRQSGFEKARNTAFTMMIIRGFLLTFIIIGVAPFVASFYEEDVLESIITLLSLVFVFMGFQNINMVLQQKELNFRKLAYLEQATAIFNFVIVITLAFIYQNIWALVIGHVLSTFITVVLSYYIIPGRPRISFDKKIAWELFHYGKYITGMTIVIYITTEIDNAVIGKILGLEDLGFYVIAYMLANLPATHFSKVLSRILFPVYSNLQNDKKALNTAFSSAINYLSLITIPVTAVFIVLSEEIITVMFGEKWLPAADSLIILATFGALRAIGSLNGYLYNAIGKPDIPFYFNLAKLIIIAVAIIPVTKHYGIVGVACVITIPLLIQYLLSLQVIARILQASYWDLLKPLVKYSILSAIMGGTVYYLKGFFTETGIISLIILLIACMIIYLLMTFKDIKDLASHLLLKK